MSLLLLGVGQAQPTGSGGGPPYQLTLAKINTAALPGTVTAGNLTAGTVTASTAVNTSILQASTVGWSFQYGAGPPTVQAGVGTNGYTFDDQGNGVNRLAVVYTGQDGTAPAVASGSNELGGNASGLILNSAVGTTKIRTAGTTYATVGASGANVSALLIANTGGAGQYLKQTTAGGAVTSGVIASGDIPSLAASIITSGTFSTAQIPSLPASIITSGTFAVAQIGTGTPSAGKYVDGGTGAWTTLPVATPTYGNVTFTIASSSPSTATSIAADGSAGNLTAMVPTGKVVNLGVAGVNTAVVSGTSLTLGSSVNLQMGSGAINLGATATITAASNQIVGASAGTMINSPTSSAIRLQINGTSVATFGAALGSVNANTFGLGGYGSNGTTGVVGIAGTSGGNINYNVASGGSHVHMANGLTLCTSAATTTAGGILRTYPTVAIANSSTTNLLTVTGHYGRVLVYDNTGQYAYVRLSNTATPVLESGSVNFIIATTPLTSQLELVITGSVLQLVAGPSAATTMTFIYDGI